MGCPDDKANLTTSVERTVRIGLRADESGSVEELPKLRSRHSRVGKVSRSMASSAIKPGRYRSARGQQAWKAKQVFSSSSARAGTRTGSSRLLPSPSWVVVGLVNGC